MKKINLLHSGLLLTCAALLNACVSIPQERKASKSEFLNRDLVPLNIKASVIESDLKRAIDLSFQSMDAVPLTGSLIATQEQELGKKNMDSDDQIKERMNQKSKSLLKGQTCFDLSTRAGSSMDAAKWENWRFKLETLDGVLHEVKPRNIAGAQSVPRTEFAGTVVLWINNTYACADKEIGFKPPFKLHIIPQFGGDSMKHKVLEWL